MWKRTSPVIALALVATLDPLPLLGHSDGRAGLDPLQRLPLRRRGDDGFQPRSLESENSQPLRAGGRTTAWKAC